jgi:protein-S-isoprenylcysteine O-methyltransferase Ste14
MSHSTTPARPVAAAEPPRPASAPTLVILVYAAAVYLLFLACPASPDGRVRGGLRVGTGDDGRAPAVCVAATGYILAGIAFEEHDLIQSLGDSYTFYRARCPR